MIQCVQLTAHSLTVHEQVQHLLSTCSAAEARLARVFLCLPCATLLHVVCLCYVHRNCLPVPLHSTQVPIQLGPVLQGGGDAGADRCPAGGLPGGTP
jgi:hypothetical protein